jgi:hypothetical protein
MKQVAHPVKEMVKLLTKPRSQKKKLWKKK